MANEIQTVFARRNPKSQQWEVRFTGVYYVDDNFIKEMERDPGRGLEFELLGFVEDEHNQITSKTKVKIDCPESNW
mgnify:CR=1 FL=1